MANPADWPGDTLRNLCVGAQRLIIAAPYIKADALARVLADFDPSATLICVTRWNPHDLAVGASDPDCRTIIVQRGGSFRLHPSLHAKYYRIDNVVLIGSANLTASALGWTAQPNLEILCRAGDDFDASAFQQELMDGSREIADEEFAYWESISKITAPTNQPIAGGQPVLETWRPSTRDPRNVVLAYQGRVDDIASLDEQRAAQRDIQALLIPPGLNDEQVRAWASGCLLATPFANSVMRLHGMDTPTASRILAENYNLNIVEARRDMETVQNWLAFFAPEAPSNLP